MNEQLKTLLELKDLDTDLFLMRDLREKRPRELEREREKQRQAEAAVANIAAAIQRKRIECDQGELELRRKQGEIEKLQIALNTSRSNDEYQVFKNQIERLRADSGTLEEAVLEQLNDVDSLAAEKKQAEGALAGVREEAAAKEAEVSQFIREVDQRIERLATRRQDVLARVPGDALQIYERVLARYQGGALAPIEGGVCQGCHMSVTRQHINQLMLGSDLVQCMNCVRILYLPGE